MSVIDRKCGPSLDAIGVGRGSASASRQRNVSAKRLIIHGGLTVLYHARRESHPSGLGNQEHILIRYPFRPARHPGRDAGSTPRPPDRCEHALLT